MAFSSLKNRSSAPQPLRRVFGVETEYGITLDGADDVDYVLQSIETVRAYSKWAKANCTSSLKWNYNLEDPHLDARGFRVKELLQDSDETNYFEADRGRQLSYQEIKSDFVLGNGARFYNDHAHPEYSTPECLSLKDVVAHDKAGERILEQCTIWRNASLKNQTVKLYKNNTDFHGHSYGCHDNYLMKRSVPFENIVAALMPFLVTRQIFAGAGKVGVEGESRRDIVFQISQRADFFTERVSIDTMDRRPIINTRDEPHAAPLQYRRLHLIVGDANMSEIATALKIGTTSLVLDLIEMGVCPPDMSLADPVSALKQISRDPTLQIVVPRNNGKTISPIDIQRAFYKAADQHLRGRDHETDWVLQRWQTVLDDLATDPMRCVRYVDWVAKQYLIETFRQSEKLAWSDPWLKSLDLEYHNISRNDGLYYGLLEQGTMERLVSDADIRLAMSQPPLNTRAYFRGRCVERFAREMVAVQWDEVVFKDANGARFVVNLNALFDERDIAHYNAAVDNADNVTKLSQLLKDEIV